MNRVIALLVALATSGVVAEENGWSSSWGPGTQANYTVTLAGTTLLTIICRDDAPLTMLVPESLMPVKREPTATTGPTTVN
ncbi:hypothetical protein [Aeromonas media]|uniref:hypothetical protein n=1 Tax=Aeromonas media TaxID=651 RepID=UPI003D1F037A